MSDHFREFEGRLARPTRLKIPDLNHQGRPYHVILPHQFSRQSLEEIFCTARRIKEISSTAEGARALQQLLPHKRAMLYFTQVSTRTFLSFSAACQLLGISVSEVRDPSMSSEAKGESVYDSIRMFSSYFDIIIMRSKAANVAESCAYLMNDLRASGKNGVPVINAGSGADQHPTQAILDMYTLVDLFSFSSPRDSRGWAWFDSLRARYPGLTKGLDNKTYVFCGDIGRGRTVRSLAYLLSRYHNVTMRFVSPRHPKLRLAPALKEFLVDQGVVVTEHESLAEVIQEADALYMTRIQAEHDISGDAPLATFKELSLTKLTQHLVHAMKDYAVVMHPFPRNDEIPQEVDLDPRAKYFEQARNGLWTRAALLAHIFAVDRMVDDIHEALTKERHDYNTAVLQ